MVNKAPYIHYNEINNTIIQREIPPSITLSLSSDETLIEALVKDSEGNPIPYVQVKFYDRNDNFIDNGTTDSDGIATLSISDYIRWKINSSSEEPLNKLYIICKYLKGSNAISRKIKDIFLLTYDASIDRTFKSYVMNPIKSDGKITIDYGDGSEIEDYHGQRLNHNYSEDGIYTIIFIGSILEIGYSAFENCLGLTKLIFNGVESIRGRSFYGCSNIIGVYMSNDITKIGADSFVGCSNLSSIVISDEITELEGSVFMGCISLTSFNIPNKVTTLGWGCLYGCSNLTSLIIPSSVSLIGARWVYNCSSLEYIMFESTTPPSAEQQAFVGIPNNCKFYIPTGSLNDYINAENYPSSSTYEYIEY